MKLKRTTIKLRKNFLGFTTHKVKTSFHEGEDRGDIISLKNEGFVKKEDLRIVKNEGDLFFFYDVIS